MTTSSCSQRQYGTEPVPNGSSACRLRPELTIDSGELAGIREESAEAYLGIPYAAQPVGSLRWCPPQAAPRWRGVRDASRFGPACPQPEDRFSGNTPPEQSEACLHLNVWTPANRDKPLPVMVWLHGGAHRIGAGSLPLYNGARLTRRGVVVVTVTFRLGYFGYFAHEGLAEEGYGGNYGLMDQIRALHWVQDNIAVFGGDPERVTLFGESAGGADVLHLMTNPAAQNLFARAIVQSAANWWNLPTRARMQHKIADHLLALGVSENDGAAELRALSADQLVRAQARERNLGFGPFLDKRTVFESPAESFKANRQARVPLLIGSNSWEADLIQGHDLENVWDRLRLPREVESHYKVRADTEAGRVRLLFRDALFTRPARWVAAWHSRCAPTWLYWFDYVTSQQRGEIPGAGHGGELPFVFDNLKALPDWKKLISTDDKELAKSVSDCWAKFATNAQPGGDHADWQPYDCSADNVWWIQRESCQAKHPESEVLDASLERSCPAAWVSG